MAASYGGFIHIIDEPRRAQILVEDIAAGDHFTEIVSAADWRLQATEILLLSLDGTTLMAASLGRRNGQPARGKARVQLSNFVQLRNGAFAQIEHALGERLADYFGTAAKGGGNRVPPATWSKVVEYLSAQDPFVAADLATLERLRRDSGKVFRGRGYETVAEEKDATALALDFSGIDRNQISKAFSVPEGDGTPVSLFRNLKTAYLLEDGMINHDRSVFGNLSKIRDTVVGETVFRDGETYLSVVNVNRTAVETALGVDLVYYNHELDAFVNVQYKRMTSEGSDGRVGYRPDAQCDNEQERMEKFLLEHRDSWKGTPANGYRLNRCPFFFKLCPNVVWSPHETGLLRGMYIPLDQWRHLRRARTGPRGGAWLTYDNVTPHITNTVFVELVRCGLIGSHGTSSEKIRQIVEEGVRSGKSVVAAESMGGRPGRWRS